MSFILLFFVLITEDCCFQIQENYPEEKNKPEFAKNDLKPNEDSDGLTLSQVGHQCGP